MPMQSTLQRCQAHILPALVRYLPHPVTDSDLYGAMHYACLNGGKRLRPYLAYTTAELFGAAWEPIDPVAVALEFIHCYSLIHDDLPAMDDDDFRRGKPTCHKVFGEGMAILAGDALLALAFEVLTQAEQLSHLPSSVILKIVQLISQAAGPHAMVKGQAQDLISQGKSLSLQEIIQMHGAKTGALIAASVQCGALATNQASESDLSSLQKYGEAIGLAFQIQDDILDCLGARQTMGKNPGQDVKNLKCTFVTQMGLERAQQFARQMHEEALAALERFGASADPLRIFSSYIIERVA